jgi:8-oxo-dGTP pyrophosphatase MutT (NUDIX family)
MVEDLPQEGWPVAGTAEHFRNWLISVRTDKVVMPDSHQVERTVITHIGAVAILALDEQDRVLMIRQYRHPVARQLWEIPAGLRDVTGEALADTARRELLEETGHVARDWHVLLDSYSSPGIITERMRVFLARGLQPADSGYQRHGEEKFLETAWVPLADAVAGALAGKLHNGATVQGILAGYVASLDRYSGLRAADAPEG